MIKQIFQDFLAYRGKNANESIIPAIFSLIHSEKNKDPAYFEFISNIIRRRSKSAFSKDSLIKVLIEIYAEITPEISESKKWQKGWEITSHIFFVLKEVDHLAIRCLLPNEYEDFVKEAIEKSEKVYDSYIKDNITNDDWNVLPILEATRNREIQDNGWMNFISGCAFTWLLYKLKP